MDPYRYQTVYPLQRLLLDPKKQKGKGNYYEHENGTSFTLGWKCLRLIHASSSTCLWRYAKELSLACTCSSVSFFLNCTWMALAVVLAVVAVEVVEDTTNMSSWELVLREVAPEEVKDEELVGNFMRASKSSKWLKQVLRGMTDSTGVMCNSPSKKGG